MTTRRATFNDDLVRARAVPIEDEVARRGIKLKREGAEQVGPCPKCGGTDRFSINVRKQLWHCRQCQTGGDVIDLVKHLDGCDTATAITTLIGDATRPAPRPAPAARPRDDKAETAERLAFARHRWGRRRPITRTLAENYLCRARGISGPLPATLGYLPPSAKYPDPALIAAFGMATKIDPAEHEQRWRAERDRPLPAPCWDFGDPLAVPGVQPAAQKPALHIPDGALVGVHLIKLLPDGSDRRRDIRDAKITIGIGFNAPIVLAPPNDGMPLIIGEGIEKVLAAPARGRQRAPCACPASPTSCRATSRPSPFWSTITTRGACTRPNWRQISTRAGSRC
jgi:CHC2 zinc finger